MSKIFYGAGEIAQSVKCLPYRCEVFSLTVRTRVEKI